MLSSFHLKDVLPKKVPGPESRPHSLSPAFSRTLQVLAVGFPELSQSLGNISSRSATNLRQALSQLSLTEQKNIQESLGASMGAWMKLDQVRDAKSYGRVLARLTRKMEASATPAALGIYQWASVNLSESPRWQKYFSKRLDVLEGRGGILARIPYFLDTFAQQATDPVMIGSFMVAGGVNALVRTSMSGYLTHHGAKAWMRDGMGRQVLAGLAGFTAEKSKAPSNPHFGAPEECLVKSLI